MLCSKKSSSWLLCWFLAARLLVDVQGGETTTSSTTCRTERVTSADGNNFEDRPDFVRSLPGWNQPLPSRWFSGYLDYEFHGRQVHTHYVLVESEKEQTNDNGKKEIPLIYWSNGGPGASSLFGLLTELGPLLLSDLSLQTQDYRQTGIPSLLYNPHTWSRLGHLLIIDQPAPVGFSYCNNTDTTTPHSCGGIAWTDELASENAWAALQVVLQEKFPCLATNNPLYLTGESYAGIYIPTLARRIVQSNDTAIRNQLQGFAVGDGCLGKHTSMCGDLGVADGNGSVFVDYWHLLFMAGHHQLPIKDFQMVLRACEHAHDSTLFMTGIKRKQDEICKAALSKAKQELGEFFVYSLYDECTYRNGLSLQQRVTTTPTISTLMDGSTYDYPCGGGVVMNQYLSLDIVKQALHVTSDLFEVDNAEGDFDYTPTEPNLSGFYQEMNGKLRILVYNGDTDPAITSFAAQNWTSHLGFQETQHWRPWTVDNCQRMGGYVTRYSGNFDFLTIRGAGHMVPTYKPEASFVFLKAWINNDDYPTFDPNCTLPDLLPQDAEVPQSASESVMFRGRE